MTLTSIHSPHGANGAGQTVSQITIVGQQARGEESGPSFLPGQLLQAVIRGTDQQGRYLLEIGSRTFSVHTGIRFQPGQKLDLQVTATRPKLTLQLVPPPLQRRLNSVLPLLAQQHRLGPIIGQLAKQQHQEPLPDPEIHRVLQEVARMFASQQSGSSGSGDALSMDLLQEIRLVGKQLLEQKTVHTDTAGRQVSPAERFVRLLGLLPTGGRISALAARVVDLLVQERPVTPEQGGRMLPPLSPALEKEVEGFLASLDRLAEKQAGHEVIPALQGKDIRTYLRNLGLQHEAELLRGDRRMARTTVKNVLAEIRLHGTPEAREQAEEGLRIIELFQLIKARFAEEGIIFYPLVLPFLKQGYLLVRDRGSDAEGHAGDGRKSATCSLHLALEALGNLRIDLDQSGDALSIRIVAEDSERTRFMAAFREELAEAVSSRRSTVIQFLTGAEPPDQALFKEMGKRRSGILETTV